MTVYTDNTVRRRPEKTYRKKTVGEKVGEKSG